MPNLKLRFAVNMVQNVYNDWFHTSGSNPLKLSNKVVLLLLKYEQDPGALMLIEMWLVLCFPSYGQNYSDLNISWLPSSLAVLYILFIMVQISIGIYTW